LGRDAAAASVWLHGWAAEQAGDTRLALRAGDLIDAMAACMPWAD
jgi:NAD(P)H-hydrate repair Nnr-like enzyme with NAD(P)H-hydrate dehydratase domain